MVHIIALKKRRNIVARDLFGKGYKWCSKKQKMEVDESAKTKSFWMG